jgi:hypothetical protein
MTNPIESKFDYIPTPSPGDPVGCFRAHIGVCPNSDCPHYGRHKYGADCRTDECGDGERECVAWKDDQREDG